MGKYLAKTFGAESRHKALGMLRRWSSSRGWPGSGRLRLAPTEQEGWLYREYRAGYLPMQDVDAGTFAKVGDENTVAFFERTKTKQSARRLLNVANVREENVARVGVG